MTDEYLYNRYERWLDTARQTNEKHVRYVAEQIVKDFEGGFGEGPYNGKREVRVPWVRRTNRGIPMHLSENDALPQPDPTRWFDILVKVPKGMQGFALQLVVEEQLRNAIFRNDRR